MTRVVLVGVGNRWRRDDGAGPVTVELARPRLPAAVEALALDGEPTRLLDAWDGADVAIVVDAMRCGDVVGTVVRIDALADPLPAASARGSHGLGLGEAVRLGRALDRLPGRLVAFGIAGDDFASGEQMTPEVTDACRRVADEVVQLVVTESDAVDVSDGNSV